MSHFWVFGYGSLMWNPGFVHESAHRARLKGLHRAPCIYSWVHRGTQERPGIVLGLAPGGSCVGMAFKVKTSNRDEVLDYLRARELVTNVYLEKLRSAALDGGERIETITYVADTNHTQYAHRLDHEALVAQIKGAVGKSGDNESYILETVGQLRRMDIKDQLMERLADALIS